VDGFDDYSLSPTYNLVPGTGKALEGDPVSGSSLAWGLFVPTDFAHGVSLAGNLFSEGQNILAEGASAFASGDFALGSADDILGADYVSILPLEEILPGAAASF
jgi:hypothetical protein